MIWAEPLGRLAPAARARGQTALAAVSAHGPCRSLFLLALAFGAQPGVCQSVLVYVEPGLASCPAPPLATTATAKTVQRGAPIAGSVRVSCGLDQGSYTVSLNSTDPDAAFAPKTFLVNFGRVAGNGVFAVRFSTLGLQGVSATITSNMGSPAVRGQFVSTASGFNVVQP